MIPLNKYFRYSSSLLLMAFAIPTFAENLSQFSQTCINELKINYDSDTGQTLQNWQIPEFDCVADGIYLDNHLFGEMCDSKALLDGVNDNPFTGCMDGATLGRLDVPNKDVEAIWICRKYGRPSTFDVRDFPMTQAEQAQYNPNNSAHLADAKYKYRDVAMIIKNNSVGKPESGKTCFFQNDLDDISDGPKILSPQHPNALSVWGTVEQTSAIGCVDCHTNDAFLLTPHVVNAFRDLGIAGRLHAKAHYEVVGADFLHYNQYIEDYRYNGCAQACHYNAEATPLNDAFWGYPKLESFSAGDNGVTPQWMAPAHSFYSDIVLYQNDFENGMGGIVTSNDGSSSWDWNVGRTTSPGTGPGSETFGALNQQHTYIYTEASSGNPMNIKDNAASAELPGTYALANTTISYKYHLHGTDIGFVDVQVWVPMFNTWMSVDGVFGAQGNEWHYKVTNLSFFAAYVGQPTKIRFKAVADGGWSGDMALDDILVSRNP